MAVDRLRKCDNVVALSEELGVHRRLLYKWRKQLEPTEPDGQASPDTREFTLAKEISQLNRLLAEKVQEIDFFKGALQKVEARRRKSESTGARASTTKSGK
jgi:transposase-like protein